jgi:hypothetical protein
MNYVPGSALFQRQQTSKAINDNNKIIMECNLHDVSAYLRHCSNAPYMKDALAVKLDSYFLFGQHITAGN